MKCNNCPNLQEPCVAAELTKCSVSREDLQLQIFKALHDLYSNDYQLIKNKVNEVCITSHFWLYFKERFSTTYQDYNIDPEYNRNGIYPKKYQDNTNGKLRNAMPDMIIHKRECNNFNFACLEFKCEWNTDNDGDKNDCAKLIAFTDSKAGFEYNNRSFSYKFEYGVQIKLYSDKATFKWFIDGKEKTFSKKNWNYSSF